MRTIFQGRRPSFPTPQEPENVLASGAGANTTEPVIIGNGARQINPGISNLKLLISKLRSLGGNRHEVVFVQPSSVPEAQTEYLMQLDIWAQADEILVGNRTEAVSRIKDWITSDQTQLLNLCNLALTSLPDTLPPTLQTLYAWRNKLTRLPCTLPATLHTLDVTANQLTLLPDILPPVLCRLYASANQLTRLPDTLPPALSYLDASANQLTSLPENILTLPNTCTIRVDGSHLSEAVRNRLSTTINAPGYDNVRIRYAINRNRGSAVEARSLQEEVSVWAHECGETVPVDWSAFQSTLHAQQFAKFLVRLRETSEYLGVGTKPNFQQRVLRLLLQVQRDPELREMCFNLAHDAVETCGDRVALRMLDMETVCLDKLMEAEIRAGKFDNDPQAVVHHVKAQYRRQVLADAASAKIKTLNFCDKVEVMLGFIVAFGGEFKLNAQMDTLLYGHYSNITPQDVYETRKSLTNQAFTNDTKVFYKPFFGKLRHRDLVSAVRLSALSGYQKSPSEMAATTHSFHQFILSAPAITALLAKKYPAEISSLKQDYEQKIEAKQAAIYEQLNGLDAHGAQYRQQCDDLQKQYDDAPREIRAEALNDLLEHLCKEHNFNACDV